MNIILLFLVALCLASGSVSFKLYGQKYDVKGVYMFSALCCFGAMLVFVAIAGNSLHFTPAVLGYAAAFAVAYGTCTVCNVLAMRCGSMSLTSLFTSYSLMVPTFYGLIFLQEPFDFWIVLGIASLAISLFLVNYQKEEKTVSLKWFLFVFFAFLGNGMCSTIQKMQQLAFHYTQSNEFMVIALLIISASLAGLGLFVAPKENAKTLRRCWHWGIGHGLLNGIMNFMVLLLNRTLPASLIFPMISCGNLLLVFLISYFVWKERLSRRQILGAAVGAVSILFFSI